MDKQILPEGGVIPIVEKKIHEEDESYEFSDNSKIVEEMAKIKKEQSMNKNFEKDMKIIFDRFKTEGKFDDNGNFVEARALQAGNLTALKNYSRQPKLRNNIIEIADDGNHRLWLREDNLYDVSRKEAKLELAESNDQRVIGIPYAMATAGDRVYIINGKVFTGWALYFSLSSIKSPEDYAKNVDLVYNVPYLFGSILLKAQLGLGAGFDVNYGSEDLEVPEEKLVRDYLFKKLRIRKSTLIKTGFHLGEYGNSYWHLRRNEKTQLVDKITILQPERLKIFLDPMTTRILFYIYLPPIIGGTTIASYPSDGRYNPNILTGVTLSYPTPIVMRPDDIIHFKINDFTEYPFGFSEVKTCIDAATARLDINILAPIIFKKYAKPMIHWQLNREGLGATQINTKKSDMKTMLQDMEPGSDPITTDLWNATVINAQTSGKDDIFTLAADMDTQIFASTGAPETYFKPKGSTDRMISEQDKTFISRMAVWQDELGDKIFEQLIVPRLDYEIECKRKISESVMNEGINVNEKVLREFDSYMKDEPKYPEIEWNEIFKQDETQSIANTIALLNARIIDPGRAAARVGEKPISQQTAEDTLKQGIDETIHGVQFNQTPETETMHYLTSNQPLAMQMLSQERSKKFISDYNHESLQKQILNGYQGQTSNNIEATPADSNITQQNDQVGPQEIKGPSDVEGTMENLRGGLKVGQNFDRANRNNHSVKDPSKLGGSAFKQGELQGKPVADKDKRKL